MKDIRDILFRDIENKKYRAVLSADRAGVLAGTDEAKRRAADIGIELEMCRKDGDDLSRGERFANFLATPKQIAVAEEILIGSLAKASGIATAARTAVMLADGRLKIVSGAWKKMPPELKNLVRSAVSAGGASFRIAEPPMLYIDKNFVRMLGSVEAALGAAAEIKNTTKCIQIRGDLDDIVAETRQAIAGGACIIMVDTGRVDDFCVCRDFLISEGIRNRYKIAFAGNLEFEDIIAMADLGVDILDIGKRIIDAPLLDMRLDVICEEPLCL